MLKLALALAVQLSIPGCVDGVCLERDDSNVLWLRNRSIEMRTAVINLPPRCAGDDVMPGLVPVAAGARVRVGRTRADCLEARLHHSRGAPIDQVRETTYQIPIARGYRYNITQASGQRTSHARWEANATDFAAQIGTPIVAARSGTVIEVRDTSTTHCRRPTKRCFDMANILVIQHEDGSVAYYVHLAPNSARVALGDSVRSGTVVASVGNTGYTTGPHLHFDVVALGPRLQRVSLPVTFALEH